MGNDMHRVRPNHFVSRKYASGVAYEQLDPEIIARVRRLRRKDRSLTTSRSAALLRSSVDVKLVIVYWRIRQQILQTRTNALIPNKVKEASVIELSVVFQLSTVISLGQPAFDAKDAPTQEREISPGPQTQLTDLVRGIWR